MFDHTLVRRCPKSFCATRWLEDTNVAKGAIETRRNILKICKFWVSLPKPTLKSYLIVL